MWSWEANYIGLLSLGFPDYIVPELHKKHSVVLFVCNLWGYLRSEVSFEGQVKSMEVNYIGVPSLSHVDYIVFELHQNYIWFYLYKISGVI